jgi:hypothetical protein
MVCVSSSLSFLLFFFSGNLLDSGYLQFLYISLKFRNCFVGFIASCFDFPFLKFLFFFFFFFSFFFPYTQAHVVAHKESIEKNIMDMMADFSQLMRERQHVWTAMPWGAHHEEDVLTRGADVTVVARSISDVSSGSKALREGESVDLALNQCVLLCNEMQDCEVLICACEYLCAGSVLFLFVYCSCSFLFHKSMCSKEYLRFYIDDIPCN